MKPKQRQKLSKDQFSVTPEASGLQRNKHNNESLHNLCKGPHLESSCSLKDNILDNIFAETLISIQGNLPSRKHSCDAVSSQNHNHIERAARRVQKEQGTRISKSRKSSLSLNLKKNRILSSELFRDLRGKMQHYPFLFGKTYTQPLMNRSTETEKQSLQSKVINSGKLVLWTERKLQKIIEGFYSYFRTHPKNSSSCNRLRKIEGNTNKDNVSQIFVRYLLAKFKTEKLSRENFVNLCYSLFYHIRNSLSNLSSHAHQHEEVLSNIRYWQTFNRIFDQLYNAEEVAFYLYCREVFERVWGEKHQFNLREDGELFYQYLNTIANGENRVFTNYRDRLVCLMNHTSLSKEILLDVLLREFKKQTRSRQTTIRTSVKQVDSTENKSGSQLQWDSSFWTHQLPPQNISGELYKHLNACIHRQCERLVIILCPNRQSKSIDLLLKSLKIKSWRLVKVVSEMSKKMWFQELCYQFESVPFEQQLKDLEELETIQHMFQDLKESSSDRSFFQTRVAEFVKKIMTPRVLLQKLELLVRDLEESAQN